MTVDRVFQIIEGDALEALRAMPDDAFDSMVTDPPAGIEFMGKEWDRFSAIEANPSGPQTEAWHDNEGANPYARSATPRFTGKRGTRNLDARAGFIAAMTAIFAEALRVLKPGAHALVWSIPRTSHWTATALEDAGFEIRDVIVHLFGTGFPKSLDVSKAIDKSRDDTGDVRPVCRFLRAAINAHPEHTTKTLAVVFGFDPRMIDHWAARDTDSQPTLPTLEQWKRLQELLGFGPKMDAEVDRLNSRKGELGDDWNEAEILGEHKGVTPGFVGTRFTKRDSTIRAATEAARQWEGWGTALKPAAEHWILCRKPLIGTVAANVIEHGTGGINIDACRVGLPSGGPAAIMEAWEQEPSLCDSCAELAELNARHSTPEIRESTAIRRAAPTTNVRGEKPRGGISKADTGCSAGPSPEGLRDDLFADGSLNTAPYGSVHTGQSLTDTSSTTSTATNSTTDSATCASCGDAITSSTTRRSGPTGRWPSNVVFSHADGCVLVGEKRVRPGNGSGVASTASNRRSMWDHGADEQDAPRGYADPDGLETVPAYDCVPECPVRMLDEQSGKLTSGERLPAHTRKRSPKDDWRFSGGPCAASTGTASRFYYQAKPAKRERNLGGIENRHPTVKSAALMAYFCRLITPPGGVVLDPFCGTGSTGIGALREGFIFFGIERDEESVTWARVRIIADSDENLDCS